MPDYKSVIDIGTNSFHLIIAEITSDGKINTVDREKVVVRLGTESNDVFRTISPNEIKRGVEVLREFKKLADFYSAPVFAVATSAVREAENKNEFMSSVKKETGIDINVIDGETEAEYIFRGVQNALPVDGKRIMCTDIGGGSTEVIIGKDGSFDFIRSFKVGAVRLSKIFFPEFILVPGSVERCSDYIENIFRESGLTQFRSSFEIAVGASGTIQAAAGVVSYTKYGSVPKEINGFSFTADELKEASAYIMKFSTMEERTAIKGIDPGRAEILPAGILILENLFSVLGITEITISSYALREGFLLSTVTG